MLFRSTTTGALVVTGGVGILGALNVGGAITAVGNITGTLATANQPNITSVGTLTGLTSSGIVSVTNNTASSTTTNGALIVSGGIGINNNINVARNISYGLTNYIQTQDSEKVQRVARKLRSGMVDVNGAGIAVDAPFGGFKHSGIGREAGEHGLEEFLEVKAVGGWSN